MRTSPPTFERVSGADAYIGGVADTNVKWQDITVNAPEPGVLEPRGLVKRAGPASISSLAGRLALPPRSTAHPTA
jgi:hypothetical protein